MYYHHNQNLYNNNRTRVFSYEIFALLEMYVMYNHWENLNDTTKNLLLLMDLFCHVKAQIYVDSRNNIVTKEKSTTLNY